MKQSIQLHLAGLSLSNTVSILDVFGVSRARSTIHNWVHKAELQPESGKTPDHVAVDETVIRLDDERYWLYAVVDPESNELLETVIRLDDERYWLYAVVDPESNELLHTKLEPTRNTALAHGFFAELRQKHHVDDATFLIDGATPLHEACRRHGLDFRSERHGNRNSAGRVFCEVKRRTASFSNCFSHAGAATADEWLRSFAVAWNLLV
ncbi:IS240-type transposase (ISH102) [Halococcus salifodinae DSM 8989]|uniref:IS240-type transposase (ISH102) n=1 Tax=Halococcus salifodinae DSM 8989 TaxID=1227456 RepID=M0N8N1_9EURY|nr:IS240-type transposase (ISH102) [Halococcus salifodinae DSM 8989]